ncbi:uncharacterized protein N7500_009418, partial [Penicillium coprophilum]|uniref:uncharacterized protein n=1 Tax=Penicillium coprophilum TaxID=36646 RepID=UPI0023A1FEAB
RCEVSIPDKHSDYPIYKLIDSSELGTKANPIVIRDNPTPLGSASNPIDCLRLDNKIVNNRATKIETNTKTLTNLFPAQKTPHSTTKRITSTLTSSSYSKRRPLDTNSVPLKLRRSGRLIKRAKQSVTRK